MSATVIINELNGVGEIPTNKTADKLLFKTVDTSSTDQNNLLTIPTSGNVCSYEKVCRLEIVDAPDNNITNVVAYFENIQDTAGVDYFYKVEGTYGAPTDLVNSSTRISEGVINPCIEATEGSPIDMDGNNTGPFTVAGGIADYLVMGLQIDNTANAALLSSTLVFEWDES